MGYISWIILGLVAGVLAKWLMPGRDGGGFIITVLLGVAGALLGGWLGLRMGYGDINGLNLHSLAFAVGGSLALLMAWRIISGQS